MEKLIISLLSSLLISGASVEPNKTAPVKESAIVAPCANHGEDEAKKYIGGRIVHKLTGEPFVGAQIIFTNSVNTDEPNSFFTRTNERGEYWFCGVGDRARLWLLIPSENGYFTSREGVMFGFFPRTANYGDREPYALDFEYRAFD